MTVGRKPNGVKAHGSVDRVGGQRIIVSATITGSLALRPSVMNGLPRATRKSSVQ